MRAERLACTFSGEINRHHQLNTMQKLLLAVLLISICLWAACGGGGAIGEGGNKAVLTILQVTPENASIAAGLTQKFTATGTFSDGTSRDMTNSVTWASSNASVASVNFSGTLGLAKGLTGGSSTISANSGSVSGNAPLAVTPAVLKSIAVSPGRLNIALGLNRQFMATGTLTDGKTQDLTATSQWSSSNSNVLA